MIRIRILDATHASGLLAMAAMAVMGLAIGLSPAAQAAEEKTVTTGPEIGLQEIVVTARRKTESAQNVPVAITAISQQEIERLNLTSLESIAASTPELTIGRAGNGAGAEVVLRGIGSQPTSIGVEQSVATVVDGVYYGFGRIIDEGFFDMAGVEILKGPQALFFGKNATAGVISIKSAEPTDHLDVMTKLGYEFGAKNIVGEAHLSGPITSTLSGRIAIKASDMQGGYVKNNGFGVTNVTFDAGTFGLNSHFAPAYVRDTPKTKQHAFKGALKWEPMEGLTAILNVSYMFTRDNADAWNYTPFACASGFTTPNPSIPCTKTFVNYINYFPNDIAGNIPNGRADGAPFDVYNSQSYTGTLSYKIPLATFTSIFNYHRNHDNWGCECQNESTPSGFISATEDSFWHAFSNESRLQTNFDYPVNAMVGFYYQSTKRDHTQAANFGGVEDSTQPLDRRYVAYYKTSVTDGKTIAGFAQLNWKILPNLELAGGARYTHETKTSFLRMDYVNILLAGLFPPGAAVFGDQHFSNVSPEATLTWKPQENITLYGAYKTAYKSGGFSNSALISINTTTADVNFNPETVKGFEAGIKTTLFDNQLRFNVAGYSYKYKNLQVDYYNSTTFQFITTNAGSAKTTGVEVEAEYAPREIRGLTMRSSVNYNDAHYVDYLSPCYGGQSIAAGCNTVFNGGNGQDLSGHPLGVAPKWTASIGGNYEMELANGLGLGLTVNARYSSEYFGSSFGAPLSIQSSYAILDAAIRLNKDGQHWQLALIGRNLTNKFYINGTQETPSTGPGTGTNNAIPADQLGFDALPRTVMLEATWRY